MGQVTMTDSVSWNTIHGDLQTNVNEVQNKGNIIWK
jgi:hypothetical protein